MQGSNVVIAGAQETDAQARASADRRARNIPAAQGEAVWFTNNLMTIKATAQSTGGAYGLVEALAPAGSGPPLHVHHREDEAFWVLEGALTVRCGDQTFTAGLGSHTFLPRDIPHTFVVEKDSPARGLSICSPGGLERCFVASGRPAESPGRPPAGPIDVNLLVRVGQDFGVEILGPPMAPAGARPA
jgi:mannose-6-phosphate isomerase-like protein (cupin superfamily)